MPDHMSRYATVEAATLDRPDGRRVAYLRRRFLPQGASLPLLAEVAVTATDRVDLLSYRTLGDPLAFWRICDANDAMDPVAMVEEAAAEPGRLLRIPVPQG